ncbi:MAG: hypothetical protein WCF84_20430 [Anaerolineae bacterium]
MPNSLIEITCPKCGHKWSVDVEEVKKQQAVIYRQISPIQTHTYRVQCPNDGTWVLVELKEKPQ